MWVFQIAFSIKLIIRFRLAFRGAWGKVCKIGCHHALLLPLTRWSFNELDNDANRATFLCKFKCIWLQIDEYLLDSLLFWANNMVLIPDRYDIILAIFINDRFFWRKVEKVCLQFNLLGICLVLLNVHDIVNSSLYIKWLYILTEPAILDLCITKNVFNI